jgi:hypothetical protein
VRKAFFSSTRSRQRQIRASIESNSRGLHSRSKLTIISSKKSCVRKTERLLHQLDSEAVWRSIVTTLERFRVAWAKHLAMQW